MDVTPAGFEVVELGDGVTRDLVVEQTGAPVCFNLALI
jgi:acyl CoA:acetate/3-ketoacid CoA transferase beta subunit